MSNSIYITISLDGYIARTILFNVTFVKGTGNMENVIDSYS